MRRIVLVSYDIADPARWRRIYRIMLGAGDPLHYSVFRCELSVQERLLLRDRLWPVLHHGEDRVLLVDLGPVNDKTEDRLESWGKPLQAPTERGAVVI